VVPLGALLVQDLHECDNFWVSPPAHGRRFCQRFRCQRSLTGSRTVWAQAGFARRAGTNPRYVTSVRGERGGNPPPAMRRQAH
jgi:hypothetical protein